MAARTRGLITSTNVRRAGAWAFPIVLWLVSTFGLGGLLGKSTDDYSTNLRDPVTQTLAHGFHPFAEYSYFWRPAHIVLIHALQSYCYEYDRLLHALSAAAHGVVVLLLMLLVRRMTESTVAAATAAMMFLVLPIHQEALFFTSTVSTLIAAALLLWLGLCVWRDGRRDAATRGRFDAIAMSVIALAISFFYEQAGACILAMPVIWLSGAAPRGSVRTAWKRPVILGTAFLGTQALMVAALLATAPAGRRGSGTSIRAFESWPRAFLHSLERTADLVVGTRGHELFLGSFSFGRDLMMSSHLGVWFAALALTGVAFVLCTVRCRTTEQRSPAACRPDRSGSILLTITGLIIALTALLPPSLVEGQAIAPRLTYVPTLGMFMAIGGALAALESAVRADARRWIAITGSPVFVIATMLGAISLLGSQHWFQSRARLDIATADRLRQLVPAPPSNIIFVPLKLDSGPRRTGFAFFDHLRPGAFETIWSATALTRQVYRRRDVWAAGWNRWRQPTIDQPTPHTVRLNDQFVIWSPFPPAGGKAGGTVLGWAHVLPFITRPSGHVHLVREIEFQDWRSAPLRIEIPLVRDELDSGRLRRGETEAITLSGVAAGAEGTPVTGWRWSAAGTPDPAALSDVSLRSIWSMTAPCTWLHPSASGGQRARMTTVVSAGDARRLVLYYTFAGYDLDRLVSAAGVRLRVTAAGAAGVSVNVRPGEISRLQGWKSLVFDLPVSPTNFELSVAVENLGPIPPGSEHPPLWVSQGVVVPADAPPVSVDP